MLWCWVSWEGSAWWLQEGFREKVRCELVLGRKEVCSGKEAEKGILSKENCESSGGVKEPGRAAGKQTA